MPLPCSTLALAIGNFVKSSKQIDVKVASSGKLVPVAMYAPESRICDFVSEFMEPACDYLAAATELLGDYPFSRLDLVMMPRCFACMGLERYSNCLLYLVRPFCVNRKSYCNVGRKKFQ